MYFVYLYKEAIIFYIEAIFSQILVDVLPLLKAFNMSKRDKEPFVNMFA